MVLIGIAKLTQIANSKGPSGNNLVMCGRMPYTARYE